MVGSWQGKLALDLVEEARQQAIRQGIPIHQVRQLPTKFQLANNRGNHVRKWFDREPTLAKKFLRAAGLICSKSNGTFIKEDITSLDDLPHLIRKVDLSRYDETASLSGDDADECFSRTKYLVRSTGSAGSSPSSSPTLSPASPVATIYQPKLKVYYHHTEDQQPFVFKVPITDLKTIDELQERLNILLKEMGQPVTEGTTKRPFVLTGASINYLDDLSQPCTSIDDISRCSLLHVRVE